MIVHRWAAVAVCFVSLLGPACAQPHGDTQQSHSQEQNAEKEHREAGPPQPTIGVAAGQPERPDKSPPKAEVYQPDCEKPKGQPDADLCVQRRVAEAAENALHWTKIQTYGALVGLALVLATLGVTAWTGKAAAIAAQAAVDAVGAERAWMFPDEFPTAFSSNTHIDGVLRESTLMVAVSWKNGGRSPAVKTSAHASRKVVSKGEQIPTFDDPNIRLDGIVGPNHSVQSGWLAIYGDDLDKFMRGEAVLYVYSKFYYSTTFSPTQAQYSEVCAAMSCNGVAVGQNGEVRPNIETHITGPQNKAV